MPDFTVAPIGTCRIHTPLRRGANRFPFQITSARNYGFVHTSREVVQQLDVLLGGPPVEARLQPLVYRPNTTEAFFAKAPASADLYVVEISSAKHVTVGEVPIQLNYANRHFGDFFDDKALARRFWSLAGDTQAKEREAWLRDQRPYQKLAAEDRELLSLIRMRELTEEDVVQDMAAVLERISRTDVLFVTHVNAVTPDGSPIASRQRLINAVRRGGTALDAAVYDPTASMKKFGQVNAMEHDGLDLTHYALPFADRLAEEWFDRFVRVRLPQTVDEADGGTKPDIGALRALLAEGSIIDASRGIREAIRAGNEHADSHRLLGAIQFQLGDYEGAIAALELVRSDHGAAEDDDLLLLQAHSHVGNARAALDYGRSLLSDEKETAEILRLTAAAAEALGREDEALELSKRLFRVADDPSEAASAVLGILQRRGDRAEVAAWADRALAAMPAHTDSFRAKWAAATAAADISALLDTARHSRLLSDADALALAEDTAAADLTSPAAALIALRLTENKADRRLIIWGRDHAARWRDEGLAALERGDIAKATDLIHASWLLAPGQAASIRAQRALEQALRREVRQAFVAKDHPRVIALTAAAINTATHFPEIDSFAGRAAAEMGDLPTALAHLRKAAAADASAAQHVQLARVAVQAGDYLEALTAYNTVLAQAKPEDWAREEAARKLGQLLTPAIRAARENADAGRIGYAWQLLDQAGCHAANRERTMREQERIRKRLGKELKAVDAADAPARLRLAQTILQVAPDDRAALRMGASAAMRLHRFPEAKDLWLALVALAGGDPQITAAIAKCDLWIDRARRKKAA